MEAETIFRDLRPGDVAFLAAHLCKINQDELRAIHGDDVDFGGVITSTVLCSSHVWVMEQNQTVVTIFGVVPISMLEGIGSIWLLATDELRKNARTLIKKGKWYLGIMQRMYGESLYSHVDARNTGTMLWLKHLGFTIHPPKPHGVAGLPFHRFEIKGA